MKNVIVLFLLLLSMTVSAQLKTRSFFEVNTYDDYTIADFKNSEDSLIYFRCWSDSCNYVVIQLAVINTKDKFVDYIIKKIPVDSFGYSAPTQYMIASITTNADERAGTNIRAFRIKQNCPEKFVYWVERSYYGQTYRTQASFAFRESNWRFPRVIPEF